MLLIRLMGPRRRELCYRGRASGVSLARWEVNFMRKPPSDFSIISVPGMAESERVPPPKGCVPEEP